MVSSTGIRLSELVERLGGQIIGDAAQIVHGVAPLEQANPQSITFLSNPRLRQQACGTAALAIILKRSDAEFVQRSAYRGALIVTDNPYAYFARTAQWFEKQHREPVVAGIHASASIDPTARISATATIGPLVCIEADVDIGEHAQIDAGCFVGRGSVIGAYSRLHARVTVHHGCRIGQRAIFYSGAVIGSDGFGFANDAGHWIKIPQTGGVVIGDDVEVGANTCIDRGALSDTVIEEGVKLDNQIQIGHNCHIGAHTAMAGCVGVAGSAIIGRHCTFGGAAMVLGHLTIADNVHISSGSMVSRSINEPGQYTGFYPLAKNADWEKSAAIVRNLDAMRDRVRAMEKMLQTLSGATPRRDDSPEPNN